MRAFTVILVILVLGVFAVYGDQNNRPASKHVNLEERLVQGLHEFMRTGNETQDLKDALEDVRAPHELRNVASTLQNSVICTLCNVAARILLLYRQLGGSKNLLAGAIKKLCVGAKIESENVCNGVVDLNIDIFIYIIDHKRDLNPEKICSIIGQSYGCSPPITQNHWSVNVSAPLHQPRLVRASTTNKKPVRVLHITDIHYDELYEPGANALCDEPLCCGSNQGAPSDPETMAGTWGDYRNCDMPWYTVLNLMDQVSTHDIDYVYYTGDIINHRVWATTLKNNKKNIIKLYEQFKVTFKSIPVYPILGNHEPNPLNEFAPGGITDPNLSTKWLHNLAADQWSYWLPNSTQETIRKGGYYTVLVRPGFRIIALNSNVCYTFNWWLLYDDVDPYNQLQWLSNVLAKAEMNNEIVHILSHIPTGDSTCLKKWSHEYGRIVQRFAYIITAQFYGHTHYDEMHFFYDSNISEPINVGFNGGSFTTYINVNPNYKIYDVNPVSWEVEESEVWIYNITEANQHDIDIPPKWYKLYSFKEAYGLNSMSLSEMGQLVKNMTTNQTLLDLYFRFKVREGDLFLQEGCDQNCDETNLCNLATSEYGETKQCDKFLQNYRLNYMKVNNIY